MKSDRDEFYFDFTLLNWYNATKLHIVNDLSLKRCALFVVLNKCLSLNVSMYVVHTSLSSLQGADAAPAGGGALR